MKQNGPNMTLSDSRAALIAQADQVVHALLGEPVKRCRDEWHYHAFYRKDTHPSLFVNPAKGGVWTDFAANESGDLFDLAALKLGLNAKRQFPQLIEELCRLTGLPQPTRSTTST